MDYWSGWRYLVMSSIRHRIPTTYKHEFYGYLGSDRDSKEFGNGGSTRQDVERLALRSARFVSRWQHKLQCWKGLRLLLLQNIENNRACPGALEKGEPPIQTGDKARIDRMMFSKLNVGDLAHTKRFLCLMFSSYTINTKLPSAPSTSKRTQLS